MSSKHIRFKTSYLEYYKNVLAKVRFCKILFKKEYKKAQKIMNRKDVIMLNRWIKENQMDHLIKAA